MLSNGLNFVRNSYKILSPTSLSLNLIRGKKKKAGGSTRNQNTNKTRGKNRRLYVEDGEWVERDYMLVKQLGLNYYPGENVIYNRWTHSIYAAIPGHVIISTETLDPNSTSPVRNYVDNMNRLLNEQKEMERSFPFVMRNRKNKNNTHYPFNNLIPGASLNTTMYKIYKGPRIREDYETEEERKDDCNKLPSEENDVIILKSDNSKMKMGCEEEPIVLSSEEEMIDVEEEWRKEMKKKRQREKREIERKKLEKIKQKQVNKEINSGIDIVVQTTSRLFNSKVKSGKC
ncbi:hypothetical protein SNEBB_002351 [Seison nebaliae]|nr:hypothetical protein SNEBB_002351 [Seison nebaliae]